MQFLLVATLAFAALWFVALRPKTPDAGAPATPAAAAKPAEPKSSLPGPLGASVDQARATKTRGDAVATASTGTPAPTAAPKPAAPAKPATRTSRPQAAAPAAPRRRSRPEPAGATPRKIRSALARGQAVVLLFYASVASDDRAVRSEIAGVSRRGGRVKVWAVSVRALSRFKNVLGGAQVLQTPAVLLLSPRGRPPIVLNGFTDRAEIDQLAAAMLRRP